MQEAVETEYSSKSIAAREYLATQSALETKCSFIGGLNTYIHPVIRSKEQLQLVKMFL